MEDIVVVGDTVITPVDKNKTLFYNTKTGRKEILQYPISSVILHYKVPAYFINPQSLSLPLSIHPRGGLFFMFPFCEGYMMCPDAFVTRVFSVDHNRTVIIYEYREDREKMAIIKAKHREFTFYLEIKPATIGLCVFYDNDMFYDEWFKWDREVSRKFLQMLEREILPYDIDILTRRCNSDFEIWLNRDKFESLVYLPSKYVTREKIEEDRVIKGIYIEEGNYEVRTCRV